MDNEEVVLWMNTVETYVYFTLPLCTGPREHIGHYHETMSEALKGTEHSGLQIEYKADSAKLEYCKVGLGDNNLISKHLVSCH